MEKRHQLMGGEVQLFKRPNSTFWYCQATVGGRQRRMSTKKESLNLAEDVAKDWFVTLQGKAAAGLLKSEPNFEAAAKKFVAEYQTVTKGLGRDTRRVEHNPSVGENGPPRAASKASINRIPGFSLVQALSTSSRWLVIPRGLRSSGKVANG